MELLTKQALLDDTPERWEAQYRHWEGADKHAKTDALKALQKPIRAADVDAIIGNTSWTTLTCDECKQSVEAIVQLGQEPDYDSSTASVCLKCLKAAVKLAKGL